MSQNLVQSVFGRKGSGKSTLIREIIREKRRVFYLDTVGEAREKDGFTIVFGMDACIEAIMATRGKRRFKIALRTEDTEELVDLLELIYEVAEDFVGRGGCCVVVEETSFFCSPSMLPRPISTLVRYGRHREIDQIYVARRPSEIHRDLTAQSDLIVSFVMHEPRDLAYLRQIAPTPEEAEAVRHLPKYKVIAWGDLERMPLAVVAQLHATPKKPLDKPEHAS